MPPSAVWKCITWQTYIKRIQEKIDSYQFATTNVTKWHVILNEFLLNIKNECGVSNIDENMVAKRVEFVRKNYEDIQELQGMLSDYITYMSNKGKEIIKSLSNKKIATSKQDDWRKEGVAIRLKSNDWDSNTNITLLLIPNGKLRIQIYVYDISDDNVNSLREYININKYSKYWERGTTYNKVLWLL